MKVTLCAFADEAAKDLAGQIDAQISLRVTHNANKLLLGLLRAAADTSPHRYFFGLLLHDG